MCLIRRTIYPVGSGGFAAERFGGFDGIPEMLAIYDCGSNTHGMNTRIAGYAADMSKVDLLFISHFHSDHVNQIKKLPITKETKVFVPWISTRFMSLLEYMEDMDYTYLVEWLKQHATVIFVDPISIGGGESNVRINEETIKETDINQLFAGEHLVPLTFLYLNEYDWLYIPFHLQDMSVFSAFMNEVLQNGFTENDLLNVELLSKRNKQKLTAIYRSTCKTLYKSENINFSTMLLASRPCDEGRLCFSCIEKSIIHTCMQCRYDGSCFPSLHNPSCLYTGDAPLHLDHFLDVYNVVYKLITKRGFGLFQLPHHGSKNGYNSDLWKDTYAEVVFVHCAENPTMHQPVLSPQAVADSYRYGIPLLMVTEKEDTLFDQEIELRDK